VQFAEGRQALLRWFALPIAPFDTMGYVEHCELYVRSDAVLRHRRLTACAGMGGAYGRFCWLPRY
jgi:predicted DCC family thiol-disulfide oxidoreductase YuxK